VLRQLDGHLERAVRHLEAGQIAQATGEIERFLRRLDRPQPPSHVSADAAATLRSLAEGVVDSWS
jgi:hypothetical protein